MKHSRKEIDRLRNLAANTNPATAGIKRKAKSYERVLYVATQMGDFDVVREVIPFTGRTLTKYLVNEVARHANTNARLEDGVKCTEWLSR